LERDHGERDVQQRTHRASGDEEIAVRLSDEKTASRFARHFPPNIARRLIVSQSDKDSVA
jgi:hypothetical protein